LKEKILSELTDLIKTLKTPNIKDVRVYGLWREKVSQVEIDIRALSLKDRRWLSEEYQKWYNKELTKEEKHDNVTP
jgi:hypothetical protein